MKRAAVILLTAACLSPIGSAPAAGCAARAPLDVALVLDRSGSMDGDRLAMLKAEAPRLLSTVGSGDQSALISFASDVALDAALTSDHAATTTPIASLRAGGLAAAGAALDLATQTLRDGRPGGRRVIVYIADGPGNAGPAAGGAASRARGMGVELFTIGLGPDGTHGEFGDIASDPDAAYRFAANDQAGLRAAIDRILVGLTTSSAASESYVARAVASRDEAGARIHEVSRQTYPPGGAGSIAAATLSVAPGLELQIAGATGDAGGGASPGGTFTSASVRIGSLDLIDAETGASLVSARDLAVETFGAADGSEADAAGSMRAGALSIAGQSIEGPVTANTSYAIGDLSVTVNRQTKTSDGASASIIVHALRIEIPGAADVVVGAASSGASCGSHAWSDPAPAPSEPASAEVRVTPDQVCRMALAGEFCDAMPDPSTLPDIDATCREVLAEPICTGLPRP